jgi:hypothetical protein
MIRSLGATAPSRPSAVEGMNVGNATTAAEAFAAEARKRRRGCMPFNYPQRANQ